MHGQPHIRFSNSQSKTRKESDNKPSLHFNLIPSPRYECKSVQAQGSCLSSIGSYRTVVSVYKAKPIHELLYPQGRWNSSAFTKINTRDTCKSILWQNPHTVLQTFYQKQAYRGLFDRASSSWKKVKSHLDATRNFYWCILSLTCFGYIRPSSGELDVELQHMVFCTEVMDGWWSWEPLRRSCVRCGVARQHHFIISNIGKKCTFTRNVFQRWVKYVFTFTDEWFSCQNYVYMDWSL